MCPSNGLILHHSFARALDKGQIIIFPASPDDIDPETKEKVDFDKDSAPYKVRILDREIIPTAITTSRFQFVVDGSILRFRNENRLSKRYLWFLAIMAIARRHRAAAPGWEKDGEILGTEMWAEPGEYVRRSTMCAIMRRIAFVEDPDSILQPGCTLRGSVDETVIDREIVEGMACR
jgi:hypothetical protein